MPKTEPPITSISDTARWVAVYRARESERPDALFKDPLARKLAGPRGEQIAADLARVKGPDWAWAMRTLLFDELIAQQVAKGADLVVNLAAGLDARPYRMPLPPTLHWVEVDLPEIIAYKDEVLAGERPACKLERVALDLAARDARRELFARVGRGKKRAVAITEGLIIYLDRDAVGALADDLAAVPAFGAWLLDLASPGLLRILQKNLGKRLGAGGAPLKFGPPEGPGFFAPHGWEPVAVRSMIQAARRHKRLSPVMRLLALLPESSGKQGSRPWAGVCALERVAQIAP